MSLATLRETLPARLAGRPFVARLYPGAWTVLLVALLFGLGSYHQNQGIGLVTWGVGNTDPANYMGVNYHVYHVAAEHALAGQPFYGVSPETAAGGYTYLYPPISVLVFLPFTLLDWPTGYTLLTVLSLLCGIGGAVLTVRYVEQLGPSLGWIDVLLISSLFSLSIHVSATIFFGNINVFLGVAFVIGFWALAQERSILAGTAFAVPALFKIFPALVGLWLLRQRRWTAIGSAVATGVGGLLAGVVLFGPDLTVEYFTNVLTERSASDAFVGGYPPATDLYITVQRPLSHLLWTVWPDAPYAVLPLSSVVLCGGILAAFYRELSNTRERLFGMFATVTITLVVVPSFRLYAPLLFLPLVALLYTWIGRSRDRILFLVGALLFSVPLRPRTIVPVARELPAGLETIAVALGTVATLQLYGFALMLLGCGWHLRRETGIHDFD